MNLVCSLDSSRDLQPIRVKSFINRLYLVLHIYVQTFNVTFFGVKILDLNRPIVELLMMRRIKKETTNEFNRARQ